MIHLHYSESVNSLRALIALTETRCEYQRHWVDLTNEEQLAPTFRKLNPHGLVPVLVDTGAENGSELVLGQSGAILLYLAEKFQVLLPSDKTLRALSMQWCLMATSDLSPLHQLIKYLKRDVSVKSVECVDYLERRLERFFTSLEQHWVHSPGPYLLPEFSIADAALFPVVHARLDALRAAGRWPRLAEWACRIEERKTVQAAIAQCRDPAGSEGTILPSSSAP